MKKMLMNKKAEGGFRSLNIQSLISAIILLIIAFNVMAIGLPLINTAATNLSATGLPLTSFFASNGIILLAIVGAMILAVLAAIGLTKGSKR